MARALLAMLCIFAGCYSAPQPDCGFLCSASSACPADYHCASDGICHRDGTPANTSCGRDAGVDARIPDSPGSDFVPPQVVLIIPGFNATNVSTSTVVQAGFDEDVINTDVGMTLRYGPGAGEAVDGIVTYDAPAHVATFTPTSPLVGNNVHTVTLSSLISDLSNNPLAPPFVWSFTTAPDDVEPIVLMTTPMNSATAVPVGSAITVVFNEPVQFFNSANVSVVGATPVTGTFSTAGPRTWVFTPDTDLPAASSINVSLASGIVDYSGNALATFSFSFTTQ